MLKLKIKRTLLGLIFAAEFFIPPNQQIYNIAELSFP